MMRRFVSSGSCVRVHVGATRIKGFSIRCCGTAQHDGHSKTLHHCALHSIEYATTTVPIALSSQRDKRSRTHQHTFVCNRLLTTQFRFSLLSFYLMLIRPHDNLTLNHITSRHRIASHRIQHTYSVLTLVN